MAAPTLVAENNDTEKINRLKLELDLIKSENDNLRTELFQVGENLKCSQANNLQLNSVITNLHTDLQHKSQIIDQNVSEKFELGNMLEVKNREIRKLKEKITELDNSSFERFEELNSSLSNAKQQEIRLKFEEKVLQNEKALYQKQIDLLGRQLEEKSAELLHLQTELRLLNSSMNEKIILQNSEISSLTSENTKLKSIYENCEKKFSDTFARYQELLQEHSSMKTLIDNQRELHENYSKSLLEENQKLQNKLVIEEQKVKDVYKLFEDQSAIHDKLEQTFNDMKRDLYLQIDSLQTQNEELKQMNNNSRSITLTNSIFETSSRADNYYNGSETQQKTSDYLQQIHELETENSLLSSQVQNFLKSGLELKGISVFLGSKRNLGSFIRIPEDLITFSDICQLQERNIELLKTLQLYYEESDIILLKNELETVKNELIEKNKLLQNSDSYAWERKNHELDSENKRMKSQIEQFQKRIDELKSASHCEIRKIEEQRNALIEENSIQKASLLTMTSQYEINKHNLDSLENIRSQIDQENTMLREMNIKLTTANENMKMNAEAFKDEIQSQKELLKNSEQKIALFEAQLEMHRNNEATLLSENAKFKDEIDSLKRNGFNHASKENCSSIMSAEAREILKAQIEELQTNNRYYREKIDRQEEKLSSTIQDFSNRIQKFQAMLEKEKSRYGQLQKEFFDLEVKYQELLEKNAQNKSNITCPDDSDDPTKAVAHDIYRLKEMIKIAEDHAAANEKAKLQLENGIREIGEKHAEDLEEMQRKIDSKLEEIQQLKSALLVKNDDIDAVAAKKDVTIGQLRDEIKQWKEEIDTLNNVAEVNHRSMEQILIEQEKMVLESDGLRQLNTQLKNKIESLKEELERSEAALRVYKENNITWSNDLNNSGLNSSTNDAFEKECSNLKEYSDILLWQIEELKAKVSANDSLCSEEGGEQGLMKVVKFLREKLDEAQKSLRNAISEINILKVQNLNLNKEIEQLKISMKKNNSNSLNEASLKELYGKASLVEMLSAKNAKLNIELQRYERLVRNMNLKISRAEKYQDEAQDMVQKARERTIENQALKGEILNYKKRMSKLETRISQVSVETFEALCNEKEELEKKVQILEPELADYKSRNIDSNKKLLTMKASLKTLETKANAEKVKFESDLANAKEEIKSLNAKFQQHVANSTAKSSEAIDERIVALQTEVDRLGKECFEKDTKIKALADKAKEKISRLAAENEKIRQELAIKLEEYDTLKSNNKLSATINSTPVSTISSKIIQSFDPKEGSSKSTGEFSRTPSTVSVAPVQAEVFKPPMASIRPTVSEPRASCSVRSNSGRQTAAVTPNIEESPVSVQPQIVSVQPNTIQPNSTKIESIPAQCVQVSEASTSFSIPMITASLVSTDNFTAQPSFDNNNLHEKRLLERSEENDECSSSKRLKVADEDMLELSKEEQHRAEDLMASSEEEIEIHDYFSQKRNTSEFNSAFTDREQEYFPSNSIELAPSSQDFQSDMPEELRPPSNLGETLENVDDFNGDGPPEVQNELEPEPFKSEANVQDEADEDVDFDEEDDDYEHELEIEDGEDEDDDVELGHDDNDEEGDDNDDDQNEEEDVSEDDKDDSQESRGVPELIYLTDSEDDHTGQNGDGAGEDDDEEDDREDDEDDNLVVDSGNVEIQADQQDDVENVRSNEDDDAEQGQGISSSNVNFNEPQLGNESQASSNTLTTTTNDDGSQVQFQNIQPSFNFATASSQYFSQTQPIFLSQQSSQQVEHFQQQQQPDSHDENESDNSHIIHSQEDRIALSSQAQQYHSQQISQPQSVVITQSSAFMEDNDALPSESGCSTDHSNDRNDVASSSTQSSQIGGPNSSFSGQDDAQQAQGSSDQESSNLEADNSANRSNKPRRGFRRGNYGF